MTPGAWIVFGSIVGAASGLVLYAVTYIAWHDWLGCRLRGHDFQPRYYTLAFCARACRYVVDGRHVR